MNTNPFPGSEDGSPLHWHSEILESECLCYAQNILISLQYVQTCVTTSANSPERAQVTKLSALLIFSYGVSRERNTHLKIFACTASQMFAAVRKAILRRVVTGVLVTGVGVHTGVEIHNGSQESCVSHVYKKLGKKCTKKN